MLDGSARSGWLEDRRKGVGSSDIAAIVGLSPWTTPFDVFNEKLGLVQDVDTNAKRSGRWLEDSIARWAASRMKWNLRRCNRTLVHKRFRWVRATPDRFITKNRRRHELAEIKTTSRDDGWGAPMTDQVVDYYRVQAQWQMIVTGLRRCWLPVFFFGTRDLRFYRVDHSPELADILLARGSEFWHEHVLTGEPPPIDDSSGCASYLAATRRQMHEVIVSAPKEAEHWATMLARANREIREAKTKKDLAENQLRALVGEYRGIEGEWGRYLWYTTDSNGVDWKALSNELFAMLELGGVLTEERRAAIIQSHVRPGVRRPKFTPRGGLETPPSERKQYERDAAIQGGRSASELAS